MAIINRYRRKYKRPFKGIARRIVRRTRLVRLSRIPYGQNKVYSFKRSVAIKPYFVYETSIVQKANNLISDMPASATTNKSGHFHFKLSDLSNYTDFTELFEKYRISGVKLKFVPATGNSSDVNSTNTYNAMKPLAVAIKTSAVTVTGEQETFDELMEHQDVKLRNGYKPFSIYIKNPKMYAPASNVTNVLEVNNWISTRNPGTVANNADIPHWGLSYSFLSDGTNDHFTSYYVFATFYIQCMNPM